MRKLICVVCGRPAVAESLCDAHYAARHALFELKPLVVQVCDNCGAVFATRWRRAPLEDVLRDIVKRNIRVGWKLEGVDVEVEKIGNNYIATVIARGRVLPALGVKTETRKVDIRIKKAKCPSCIKLLGRYHEAVVQIRGERAGRLMEAVEAVVRGMPVRVERLKYGWDLYFVNKADARATVRKLNAELKRIEEGRLKVVRSYRLVGKKAGKELWRDFYAIR